MENKKPSLLYASPFWPRHSGVSDYSSALVRFLSEYWDVTLLTDDYTVLDEALTGFPAIRHTPGARYHFDAILYNFANDPEGHLYMLDALQHNPGWIILHSFSLFNLMIAREEAKGTAFAYLIEHYGINGIRALQDSVERRNSGSFHGQKDMAAAMPMNEDVINLAQGVFVHSRYTENMVRRSVGQKRLTEIPRLIGEMEELSTREAHSICAEYWGIPGGAFTVVSTGFINPNKQCDLVCRAVTEYNRTHSSKIYYLMVGEGESADAYLNEYCRKTGFVSNAMLSQGLARADLFLNLRNPTNGETSGTLLQAMRMGRDCVATAVGWYDELPDDTVLKVSPDVTVEELIVVFEDAMGGGLEKGERAREYVLSEYDGRRAAKLITDSMKAML